MPEIVVEQSVFFPNHFFAVTF